jgi:hypothetical protein
VVVAACVPGALGNSNHLDATCLGDRPLGGAEGRPRCALARGKAAMDEKAQGLREWRQNRRDAKKSDDAAGNDATAVVAASALVPRHASCLKCTRLINWVLCSPAWIGRWPISTC